jgi:nucleoid DNA-binding protein
MIPKKSSKIYKELSEELNIEESLIEDLMEFYYKRVRENLSELKHPRINLEGLGHFVIKELFVKESIPKIEKSLTRHDTSTFSAYFNKKSKETKLEKLKELKKKIDLENERKLESQNKRDEYIKNNMGEQETDSGGNN